jgi:hypothetical protein
MTGRAVVVVAASVVLALAAGCAGDEGDAAAPTSAARPAGGSSTTATVTTTGDPPAPTAPATSVVAPSTSVDVAAEQPDETAQPDDARAPYAATIVVIDGATRARMTYSWREGCPVPIEDLRLLTLPHWNEAGQSVSGELVVHADAADAMVESFRRLYEQRFPIARMELVDVYQADDQASMRANNTSAFNCREIDGRPGTWSQHSFGRAVDVNPLVNPWVRGSQVDPPEAAAYADRSVRVPGGIYAGDDVVAAFAAVGWEWGGYWSGSKDYQHFSANGR